jgi:hypothetical protein
MMGLFDAPAPPQTHGNSNGLEDLMGGFGTGSAMEPPPPQSQRGGAKKTNEDLLGMF